MLRALISTFSYQSIVRRSHENILTLSRPTLLFEKRFLRKECKEHSIVCITALVIIDKIVLFIDAIDCLAMVKNFIEYIVH